MSAGGTYLEKEVGNRPTKELLALMQEEFEFPTINTRLLLMGATSLGPRLRRIVRMHRRLEQKFTEFDQNGGMTVVIKPNKKEGKDKDGKPKQVWDGTWGSGKATTEQLELFIWSGREIDQRLTLSFATSPRTQARYHGLFDKIELGKSTFTQQRTEDERGRELERMRPRLGEQTQTPPQTQEEKEEEQSYPMDFPEGWSESNL